MKLAAAAALVATSCSFYIVSDKQAHNECTSAATPAFEYAVPALDAAGLVTIAGVTYYKLHTGNGLLDSSARNCSAGPQGNGGTAICPLTLAAAVVAMAAYAVAATYGVSELHACRSRPARVVGP